MARVQLLIQSQANHLTVKAILERDGHSISTEQPDVIVTDSIPDAVDLAQRLPTLVLATISEIPEAIRAMRGGVFGYILLPFQPGETEIMVRRTLAQRTVSDDVPLATLEEVETAHILEVLRRCKHNKVEAARVLRIGRNTLWRKLARIRAKQASPK